MLQQIYWNTNGYYASKSDTHNAENIHHCYLNYSCFIKTVLRYWYFHPTKVRCPSGYLHIEHVIYTICGVMHRVQLIHTPVSYILYTILRTHTMKIKFAAISPRIFKGIVNISIRRTAKRFNLGIMKATSFRHWHLFPRPTLQLRASMTEHCTKQI